MQDTQAPGDSTYRTSLGDSEFLSPEGTMEGSPKSWQACAQCSWRRVYLLNPYPGSAPVWLRLTYHLVILAKAGAPLGSLDTPGPIRLFKVWNIILSLYLSLHSEGPSGCELDGHFGNVLLATGHTQGSRKTPPSPWRSS